MCLCLVISSGDDHYHTYCNPGHVFYDCDNPYLIHSINSTGLHRVFVMISTSALESFSSVASTVLLHNETVKRVIKLH